MRLSPLFVMMLSFPFAGMAYGECKLPVGDEWVRGASSSFAGMTASIWRKKEEVSMANQALEARLVLVKNEECLASYSGERRSGTAIVPWGDSKIGKFYFDSKTEFLQVSSDYHHGYIEENTALFHFDSKEKTLKKVWSETTKFIAHNGESDNHEIKVSGDELQLLDEKGAKVAAWKWNAKKSTFVKMQ